MMKYLFLIPFILCFSCKSKNLFSIAYIKEKGVELLFYSERDTSIIIDIKAFGDECYNKEIDDLIIDNHKNIDSIACKIKYNQAILVDENNEMRFLTTSFQLPNEIKELEMINCMEDWNYEIDLKANETFSLLLEKKYMSDLMVTEKTSKIKIFYLHKDVDSNKCASIMESNWIDLK